MNIFEIMKAKRLTKEQKLQKGVENMLRHSHESTRRATERLIEARGIDLESWNPTTDPHHLINTVVIAVLEHEAEIFKNIIAKSIPTQQTAKEVNNIKSFL